MCCVFNLLMNSAMHHPVILVVSTFFELGVFGGLFPLICSIALEFGVCLVLYFIADFEPSLYQSVCRCSI